MNPLRMSRSLESGRARRIGPWGTLTRVVVGVGLLTLALADQPEGWILGLQAHELLLGLVGFPGVMIGIGLLGRRFSAQPLRFTGSIGVAVNAAVLIALFTSAYTAGAAALFYGGSLLAAAWFALPGCEATVVSNLLLDRDDQIGCPTMTPIDVLEAHLGKRGACRPSGHSQSG
jgi:hypothetical protein